MIYFYHFLSLFIAIFLLPLFSIATLFSKHKFKGLIHHFGWVPKNKGKKTLWMHSLSMGEVVAATPVLKKVREQYPDLEIALSVTTDSGYESALNAGIADHLFFHPLDCLPFTQLALSRINPVIYVVTDTGFWPGLIDLLYRKNIPVLLFNGRISERSARKYRLVGSLFKETFKKFQKLGMQNRNSKKAALMLGVEQDRVEIMGDPKYDVKQLLDSEGIEKLRDTFMLDKNTPVWIAGSTHAGEEEIILEAHQQLVVEHPDLILILAPRRIERVKNIADIFEQKKVSFAYRSSLNNSKSASVILLDTMGELAQVFALGQVAFIGNSLVKPGGGHSLKEPLVYGLSVMHGPFIENIRHVAEKAHEQGLTFPVQTPDDIKEIVNSFLKNPDQRKEIQEKAQSFIKEQQGASEKMVQAISEILG
ncbi:MAG: hypothetical protein F3740_03320 [Nitrospinae bacterium]|nr:hypothetical protein [Nitrospinota bacterium]